MTDGSVVVAWRAWSLRYGELSSVTRPDRWPADGPMRARCLAHRHLRPVPHCGCGIHAATTLDQAAVYHRTPFDGQVIGCVALWGRLIEGTRGWRAENARPLVLFAGADVAEVPRRLVGTRYGVESRLLVGRHDAEWTTAPVAAAAEALRRALEGDHGRWRGVDGQPGPVRAALADFVHAATAAAVSPGPPVTRA